ncbi:MSCRAMM family protein [Enterococcus mundtii]|uniref:SpaA-like prealbumin fold domain-containing protein n=1 Tax=Enterococcus mundtii TaxID=53346 RepID=A0A2S7RUQ1_ENTMU|nr:SpaA isopeptide-forming pilin-related protein [Enterococcus mundtii]PQF23536.1 hypothetical protein CUS89_06445 [Enterococcus mundtii]
MKKSSESLFLILPIIILITIFFQMNVRPVSATTLTNLPSYQQITTSVSNQMIHTTEQSILQENSWANFKKNYQLIQDRNGKLSTIGSTNYVDAAIHEQSPKLPDPFANESVVVDPAIHIPNIDIHLSNGGREFGWYGKRVKGEIALCLEQGVALNIGENNGYTSSIQNTELLKKISLIKYYGVIATNYTMEKELMTQLLAWEQQGIIPTSISGVLTMNDYQIFKRTVMEQVERFYTQPSFHGQIMDLKVGESQTLTDTTGAFSNYGSSPVQQINGITIEKQGNQVTVTASKEAPATSEIAFDYHIPSSYQGAIVVYQHPYTQNMVVGRVPQLTRTLFQLRVQKYGHAGIRKVDQQTKQPLVGAVFRFTTTDGQIKELTTDSDGVAIWHDLLVDTVVTIQEIKAPDGYVLNPDPQTIIVKVNELTSITLANQEQTADLIVIKEDEETGSQPQGGAQLIGAVYQLTDKDGEKVAELTMEEVDGRVSAELRGLKLGTYYLQEIIPPKGYNLDPTIYPIHLTYAGQNETVAIHSKTVTDRVIKGHVEGYKFGSKPLVPTSIFEVLHALTTDSTNYKPPLEGIELTATAHNTGKEYVHVTEKNGYFKFIDLPYDTYTIAETKGTDGYLIIEPFEVTISEEGYTHFFLLEDEIIESRVHLIKIDQETGQQIPYAGAQFKIFDTWANDGQGAFVAMTRPNDTEKTEIFETNQKGELVTTESLPWGVDRYELHEVKAPEGYLPLEEPLIFSVTAENHGALIRLEVPNRLARQSIELIKRDRLNEQPLAQVPFGLYQVEKAENGEQNLQFIEEYLTDDEGRIEVSDLPYGIYQFIEGKPLEGYLPLEEPLDFSVTVEKDGELIVLEAYNEREKLTLTSLFTAIDGSKELDPTKDNQLKDVVWIKGAAIEIGHVYTVVTQYRKGDTGELMNEAISTYTAKSKEDQFEVFLELKANTLKDKEQLTATHILYYESEQENEVAREDDLTNQEQTVHFNTPKEGQKDETKKQENTRNLPKTNSRTSVSLVGLGSLFLGVSGVLIYQQKRGGLND